MSGQETSGDAPEEPAATAADRFPEPTRRPDWFRPVFVLAPARSNSSVVSSMIGMHPDLYGFPELTLWRGATVGDLLEDRPGARGPKAEARTSGLARAVAEVFQGQQDVGSVSWARTWLQDRSHWSVAAVFDELQGRVAPLIALEKSPENSNRQDFLERLDQSYPRARFIHLTRHPVPTVKSMYAAWRPSNLWDVPDHLWHMHLLGNWMFHHGRIRTFLDGLPPDRWIRVRSEDVLNSPEETLPDICRWLGVDSGPGAIDAMMNPQKSPYARLGPQGAVGGNDPGFLRKPAPRRTEDPASLDLPPEWVVDPWTHVAVVHFAASIGYQHRRS
jgi:hypothetical protein